MEKQLFNVPSVISQSFFTDLKGDAVDLTEREIDYFYFLLFLYRKELLEQTSDLFIKNTENYSLNTSVKYEPVDIELIEFKECGVVTASRYNKIRSFINKLSNLSIIPNMFDKNRSMGKKAINMIGRHSWNGTLLTIYFTKDFTNLIVHIEKYFMKVDLNNLLSIAGKKAKLLYLLLKDYSKSGKKDLKRDELEKLIGKIPQKVIFDGIIEQINLITDITVSYKLTGIRKKRKYKFTIREKSKPKVKISVEMKELVEKRLERQKELNKKTGKPPIENEVGYKRTILNKEMKIQETKNRIDVWLEDWKEELGYDNTNPELPFVVIDDGGHFPIDEEKGELYFPLRIDNEYRLIRPFTTNPLTDTPKETIDVLNKIVKTGIEPFTDYQSGCSRGNTKSCFLSTEELERRGAI